MRIAQIAWIVGAAALLACGGAKVRSVAPSAPDAPLPAVSAQPPSRIFIQPFSYDPEVVRLDAAPGAKVARVVKGEDARVKQIEVGDEVAVAFAKAIGEELKKREIRSAVLLEGDAFAPGSMVLEGEFLSINQGNRLRRLAVGFGVGATSLSMKARLVRAHESGTTLFRELDVSAHGSRKPGITTPAGISGATGAIAGTGIHAAGAPKGGVENDAARSAKKVAEEIERIYIEAGWKAAPE